MGRKIINSIRGILFKILAKLIPEMKLLKSEEVCWSYYKTTVSGSDINRFAKLLSPCKIYQSKVGEGTYIAPNSIVSMAQIGKYCSIGPNFLCGWGIHPTNGLSTSPMFYSTLKQNGRSLSKSNKIEERKEITIGNDVFIGANVTVLDGCNIGDGAVIGAGAVVSKDIPPYAIAVGCPIKIIRYRFSDDNIKKLLQIKWWNFDNEKIQDVEKYFFDLDFFLNKYSKE